MRYFQRLLAPGVLTFLLALALIGCSKEAPRPAAKPEASPATGTTGAEATASPFTVTIEAIPSYTPGKSLAVKTTMNYTGAEPVTALAIQTTLPQAWTYGGIRGDIKPAIDPPAGTAGQLTLIWIQIPSFPATIEYTLDVPEWTEGTHKLSTQAIYRTLGGELQSPIHEVAVSQEK
jgi:hypothetical protein